MDFDSENIDHEYLGVGNREFLNFKCLGFSDWARKVAISDTGA